MPNTLLTPQIIARTALAALYENIVAAQLVHRDYENEFANKVGAKISIRKPAVFEAKEYNRAQGIEVQNANEGFTDITLNHFADVSFGVTSEDMTLRVQDFDEQFLTPAMEAMAQKIDRDILAEARNVPTIIGGARGHVLGEDYKGYRGNFPWDDSRVLVQAGGVLTAKKVPLTERRFITGPVTSTRYLAEDIWRETDKRGSTEGLTEARFGARTSGFDPYVTQNIVGPADGVNGTELSLAFHKTAFALAVRPLALPRGAKDAAIVNYKGLGLRVIYDYDMDQKQDVISIDCLYGTKTLDAERAVVIGDPTYDPDAALLGAGV